MTTRDLLGETITALTANKVRTALTMLGIVIGISSVIAMVSIGTGAKNSIQSSIEGLGSNLLSVFPGAIQPGRGIISSGRGSSQTLKNDDVDAITEIVGVRAVSPELDRRFQLVSSTGNNTNVTVIGVTEPYVTVHNTVIDSGTFITDSHVRSLGRVVVLGPTVASDLFGDDDPLGKTVKLGGNIFRVVGVLKAKGGAGGFGAPDNMAFVPLSVMQKVLAGSDYVSNIGISVESKEMMPAVQAEATRLLTKRHRVTDPDFSIISNEDILGTLTQVTDTFTLFLASIAGISLVVGGIGIMNMMLTTVTERTREIGLRKAVGARRGDISRQFLAEAIVLTLFGGMIGVVLGWAIAASVNTLGIVKAQVSLSSVLLAFGVSAAIGIVFGYYPARRASRLNPIDALRYE